MKPNLRLIKSLKSTQKSSVTKSQQERVVQQATLQRIHFLRYQIRQLQAELGAELEGVRVQIEDGCRIEDGAHTAWIERKKTGGVIRDRVKVR